MRSSRDVIIQADDFPAAVHFYRTVMGFAAFEEGPALVGFDAGSFRLFVEPGALRGPVFEFHVAEFEAAKTRLLSAGCIVIDDDPSVPRCYMRDRFGLAFNLASVS